MKATKKVSKSIVIKSAKFGKLESWDSPEPVARKVATPKKTPLKTALSKPSPVVAQRTQAATPPRATVQPAAPCVPSPEDDESDSLIKKYEPSPDRHSAVAEDEEEDGIRRMNQGMLCILPPTVFSFIFGNDSAENL